jgi:MYXO-CTERM domain-containing protein
LVWTLLGAARDADAATREVGPGKTYAKPCEAIAAAAAGDVIEVDAAGNYDGDHCTWTTDNLTVKGVGGRAKIDAGKDPTNTSGGKGIFVIGAPNATIESFELAGATVADQNGAGIRHQGTNLTVRDCYFHDNDDGILGSPKTNGTGEVLIERSEFSHNGFGDGQSHNMYLNHYAELTLRFSYSHGAVVGHLLKSRAYVNVIEYNRLTDEAGGTASYEANFPDGGLVFLIGNVIEQSAASQNHAIIDYASESTSNPDQHLYVINDTIVNDASSGTFVQNASATPEVLWNDLFVGPGLVTTQTGPILGTNFTSSSMGDPKLAGQATYDYHLLPGSPCVNVGSDPGSGSGRALAPVGDYVHPLGGEARSAVGAIDIGAYELGNPGGPFGGGPDGGAGGDAGAPAGGADGGPGGSSGSSGGAPAGGADASAGAPGDGDSSSGCGCRVEGGGDSRGAGAGALAIVALAALATRRRRALEAPRA